MDIRRLKIWESRNATIMTNDIVQLVIEDQGGVALELSAHTPQGGMINAHYIPSYRGFQTSVYSDENYAYWKNTPFLYQKAGSFFSFPHYGPEAEVDEVIHEAGGYTASSYWMVDRYGTDSESGGVWLLSSLRDKRHGWSARKIDMLLPGHPVHYSAIYLTNHSLHPLVANAVWNNEISSPFLEAECVINASADTWITGSLVNTNSRLADDTLFSDLRKVPLKSGGAVDLSEIPFPNGKTDLVSGRMNKKTELGYSSIINPRMQMLYFTFFPGPKAQAEDMMPMHYNSFLFDLGGRTNTPHALYDGGVSQTYSVAMINGIHNRFDGLTNQEQLLEADTTFILEPNETKHFFYGTAFTSYENARMGNNFFSVETQEEAIILKRTKSTATILADSNFKSLKSLAQRIIQNE